MAVFEMPLEELLSYQGVNPKPKDFDIFWEESIKEMHALGYSHTLEKAEFQAPGVDCFDLWFTGVTAGRVYAKLLIPKGAKKAPAVLHFHGYAGSSGDWSGYLRFVQAGFVVAALDCRGQGGKSQDKGAVSGNTLRGHIIRGLDDPDPKNMLTRTLFLDTAHLARIVMSLPSVDESRVGATGASQGGALSIACAALEPRVKLTAPVYPFMCDYKRVWDMDLDMDAYIELRDYFRRFDPRHIREDEVFERLGYIDLQHLAPRIRAEVLLCCGLMDTICPPSTQFAAYNKITSKKRYELWPDFGHENLPEASDIIYQFLLGL